MASRTVSRIRSRIYKSGEFIVSKRFSNVQFYGSYVLSKLDGNYQGSYRSDNGQNDPNISSMFDFTNSDGRLTGQDIPGVLEHRSHAPVQAVWQLHVAQFQCWAPAGCPPRVPRSPTCWITRLI